MDTDTIIECTNWDEEVAVATWVEERVGRVEQARQERVHVSSEAVVACPRCGFEFKVGKSLK